MAEPPFYQSNVFWAGIIISAVLSIPTAVLGNYAYYRILAYLESRKIVTQEKSKKRAFAFKAVIDEIRAGKRDKYVYVFRLYFAALFFTLASILFCCAGGVIIALVPTADRFTLGTLRPTATCLIFLLFALFGELIGSRMLVRVKRLIRALDDYESYAAEFKKRWEP